MKRVEIPKPDGGVRKLGIPTVLSRFVQQAVMQVLQRKWDLTFSDPIDEETPQGGPLSPLLSNWGFRRRRTLIPKGTRTAFRAEGERFSERSDAGTSIVPEVFGFVKKNLSGA